MLDKIQLQEIIDIAEEAERLLWRSILPTILQLWTKAIIRR